MFNNKHVALVTGGTRGIGLSIVKALVSRGVNVIATGQSSESVSQMRNLLPEVDFLVADFTSREGTEAFIQEIQDKDIDILINNAGINKINLTEEVDIDDWDRIQSVNVRAPLMLCKAIAPKMAKKNWGRIINITSIFGAVSKSKRVAYSTSKFGLLGMTKAIALDYGESNVLVNGIGPGFTDTELTRRILTRKDIEELTNLVPMKRLATVEDISNVVLFFASEMNTFVTGQNIIVDGGFTCV